MNTKGRIEKCYGILQDMKAIQPGDAGVIPDMKRIVTQLLLIVRNQQEEIESLKGKINDKTDKEE